MTGRGVEAGSHNLPAIFVATCWPRSRLAIKLFMPSAAVSASASTAAAVAAAVAHERLNAFNLFMHLPHQVLHSLCQLCGREYRPEREREKDTQCVRVRVVWRIVACSVRCLPGI